MSINNKLSRNDFFYHYLQQLLHDHHPLFHGHSRHALAGIGRPLARYTHARYCNRPEINNSSQTISKPSCYYQWLNMTTRVLHLVPSLNSVYTHTHTSTCVYGKLQIRPYSVTTGFLCSTKKGEERLSLIQLHSTPAAATTMSV